MRKIALAPIILSLALSPYAYAQESKTPTISQGDMVLINGNQCTVGYVDKETRKAFIDNHCSPSYVSAVYDSESLYQLGLIEGSYNWDNVDVSVREDIAVIDIFDDVEVGKNFYSGDKRVRAQDVEIEDELCMYSRMQRRINCGKVISVDGNLIAGDKGLTGQLGDSGTVAWIPGKGAVGLYTLITGIWDSEDVFRANVFTSLDQKNCDGENPIDLQYLSARYCDNSDYAPYSPSVASYKPLPSLNNNFSDAEEKDSENYEEIGDSEGQDADENLSPGSSARPLEVIGIIAAIASLIASIAAVAHQIPGIVA